MLPKCNKMFQLETILNMPMLHKYCMVDFQQFTAPSGNQVEHLETVIVSYVLIPVAPFQAQVYPMFDTPMPVGSQQQVNKIDTTKQNGQ